MISSTIRIRCVIASTIKEELYSQREGSPTLGASSFFASELLRYCLFLVFSPSELPPDTLFYNHSAGYPLIAHFTSKPLTNLGGFNLGGINASGQVPVIASHYFSLIDPDTPKEVWTKNSIEDGTEMNLVFSDEFNVDGRSFYPGDDPYWEAVNLNYW